MPNDAKAGDAREAEPGPRVLGRVERLQPRTRHAAYRAGLCVLSTLLAGFLVSGHARGQSTATVVEYYNASLDHYFVTPLQPDIDALDSGRTAGWRRTGQSFEAYPAAGPSPPGASPVCRFYIPPQHGDSHFFSASPAECADVQQKIATDPNYSGYVPESPNVFMIQRPDTTSGACPAGTVPVYRLWNQRSDSNHRYVTDAALKASMLERGYAAEGYGPDLVNMCAAGAATFSVARVTGTSPLAPGCSGPSGTATLFTGSEVEPTIAVDPRNADRLIGMWQQDRWSSGGAAGLVAGLSLDGGRTWSMHEPPFSHCTGGDAANGGDYARTTDPWVSVAPDGTAYASALSFTGGSFAAGSSSAVLVSRSTDGGTTWAAPTTVIRDGAQFFNDKEAVTADPTDARYAYATWDRLAPSGNGPTYFSRTSDGGATWEPARAIFDPGVNGQTLGNQVVVLSDGTVVDFFTIIIAPPRAAATLELAIARSPDKGVTWSAPIVIAQMLSVGVSDPGSGTPVRDAGDIGSIAAGPNGELAVVWQDGRFSGGARDGIAYAASSDGGSTWSAPLRINADPTVAAFIPIVHFDARGTLGVMYYDFREAGTVAASVTRPDAVLTNLWLARSADGREWTETRVAGPFALALAPRVPELFVGDYQGLTHSGDVFLPLFVQTNADADANNRTDVFAARIGGANGRAYAAGAASDVKDGAPFNALPGFSEAVQRNAVRSIARRRLGP